MPLRPNTLEMSAHERAARRCTRRATWSTWVFTVTAVIALLLTLIDALPWWVLAVPFAVAVGGFVAFIVYWLAARIHWRSYSRGARVLDMEQTRAMMVWKDEL